MYEKTIDQLMSDNEINKIQRINRIKSVLRSHINDSDIQPGAPDGNGKTKFFNGAEMTFCNQYFFKCLLELTSRAALLFALNPKTGRPDRLYTTIEYFYKRLKDEDSKNTFVKIVTAKEALNYCLNGIITGVIQPGNTKEIPIGHIEYMWPEVGKSMTESGKYLVYGAGSRDVMGLKDLHNTFYKYGFNPDFFIIRSEL